MWQQRSHIQWLKNGDQNTKFFHGTATQRKRRNFLKGLRDENGVWQEDEEVFSKVLNRFYASCSFLLSHMILTESWRGFKKLLPKR